MRGLAEEYHYPNPKLKLQNTKIIIFLFNAFYKSLPFLAGVIAILLEFCGSEPSSSSDDRGIGELWFRFSKNFGSPCWLELGLEWDVEFSITAYTHKKILL